MTRMLVAIPCKDEAAMLASVIARIPRNMSGISRVDVLVVDDGSTDGTSDVARDAGVDVVRHRTNRGVGVAFQTAVESAITGGYDLLVTLDGDGQFSPEEIPALCAPVLTGAADVATGSRFLSASTLEGMPSIKRVGNAAMSALVSRLTGGTYRDVSCGFRCYGIEALVRMNLHGGFTYTQETFLDLAANRLAIAEVPITVQYFGDRRSRVADNLWRYGLRTGAILLRGYRDYFPLRFFTSLGLVPLLGGLGFAAVFFANFLRTGQFTGYLFAGFTAAFLISVALLLLLIGLVADMLDRSRRNQERVLALLRRQQHAAAREAAPEGRS
jgi:glycosyltransferase involved in cell wall biosynthesis